MTGQTTKQAEVRKKLVRVWGAITRRGEFSATREQRAAFKESAYSAESEEDLAKSLSEALQLPLGLARLAIRGC